MKIFWIEFFNFLVRKTLQAAHLQKGEIQRVKPSNRRLSSEKFFRVDPQNFIDERACALSNANKFEFLKFACLAFFSSFQCGDP